MKSKLTLLLLLCALSAHAAEVRYANPRPYSFGKDASGFSPVIADFTGDGRNDVLVLSDALIVLPGTSAGTLGAAVITEQIQANSISGVGDFNRDGRMDVALETYSREAVVALADAGGHFSVALSVPSMDVEAVGDFNGDGNADLLAKTPFSDLKLYPGGGNGTFGSALAAGTAPWDEWGNATGDFDGDGRLDVAVSRQSGVVILWNDGSSFSQATLTGGGHSPAAADFNGDGMVDLAFSAASAINVWFGTRGSRAVGEKSASIPVAAFAVHAADFDGNGRADLVAQTGGGTAIALAQPNETFGALRSFLTSATNGFAAGDVDGDHVPDLAIVREEEPGVVRVARGRANGTLEAIEATNVHAAAAQNINAGVKLIEVLDSTGDGRPDVVTYDDSAQRICVLPGLAGGLFGAPACTPTFEAVVRFTPAGDLDGDGREDIILEPSARVLHGTADGRMRQGALVGGLTPAHLGARIAAVADFDGDGKADLLDVGAQIARGNGDGTFQTPYATNAYIAYYGAVATDVNGDGLADVVAVESATRLHVYLNQRTTTFREVVNRTYRVIPPIGDLNGDGLADLLASFRFFAGLGDGTFRGTRSQVLGINTDQKRVQFGDFDGDGKVDVVVAGSVVFGNGDGTFRSLASAYAVTDLFAIRDADGDGVADLFVRNGGLVAVLPPPKEPVGTLPTTITLEPLTNPSQYGAGVLFSARVSATNSTLAPRGAIRFEIGDTVALVPVGALGVAQATGAFDTGTTVVRATYAGDENFAPATVEALQQATKAETITTGATWRTIGGTAAKATQFRSGEPVQFSVVVKPKNGSAYTWPSADVVVSVDGTPAGTLAASSNDVPLLTLQNVAIFTVGTHTVTFDYAGEEKYLPSSQSFAVTVLKALPSIAFNVPQLIAGQKTTLTATLAPADATGTLTFRSNGTVIGTANVVDGAGSIETTFATAGPVQLSVEYSGDSKYDTLLQGPIAATVNGFDAFVPALTATARKVTASSFAVDIAVSPVNGATAYDIYRATNGVFVLWRTITTTTTTDTTLPLNASAVYEVIARAQTQATQPSLPDFATAVAFTNDPLIAGSSMVRVEHITELQTAANAARVAIGIAPATFTAVARGHLVRASQIVPIRKAIDEARAAAGLAPIATSPVATGLPILAANVQTARDAIR